MPNDLQASLDPVQLGQLEELSLRERLEQRPLALRLGRFVMELIQDPDLEQLLVGNTDLDWVALGAAFLEPRRHNGDVVAPAGEACPPVEGLRGPEKIDGADCALVEEGLFAQDRLHAFRKGEGFEVVVGHLEVVGQAFQLLGLVGGDRVYHLVEVEGLNLGVLVLDEDHCRLVVGGKLYLPGTTVVEVGEGNLILCSYLMSHNDLINVVEFIPVLVFILDVSVQRFKLRTSRDRHVQRLGREEAALVKEVEVVLINQIAQQLVRQSVQVRHHRQGESPQSVRRSVNHLSLLQRLVVVEPVENRVVFLLV